MLVILCKYSKSWINFFFGYIGTSINRITGWTYKATRLAMSKTVCTSCEFVWSIMNKMWKFPSPTWPSMYAPESTNRDTYNAILTDTSWTVLISSGLLWSTGKKTWKFPSPTWPTIGPVQIKVTKQHHEACVFYLRDIQKIHLEYILRKHTQLYMYIGVGLWDKLKCIFFLSKNKRQKLKQGI